MPGDRPPVLHPQKAPKAPPPGGPTPAEFVARMGALARLAGARVLVVEDDDDGRELIYALIKMAGATVLCVKSVAQAMDGVNHSFDPDVVLTDSSMPGPDPALPLTWGAPAGDRRGLSPPAARPGRGGVGRGIAAHRGSDAADREGAPDVPADRERSDHHRRSAEARLGIRAGAAGRGGPARPRRADHWL